MSMEKELKAYIELLNTFEFEELEKELNKLPDKKRESVLRNMAYKPKSDQNNLLVYTFLFSLIVKDETSQLHLLLSKIMGLALNHISQAETIGLYHGLKALQLDPENVDIMEYLLYFNQIPEKLLSDDLATSFAERIIDVRPNSVAAKMRLGKF